MFWCQLGVNGTIKKSITNNIIETKGGIKKKKQRRSSNTNNNMHMIACTMNKSDAQPN